MNDLQIFKNEQFGEIRVTEKDGQAMFCLSDVCKILDIKNVTDCKDRLKKDGVVTSEVIDSLGREQQANFINESNLYKVIFQSRKPEAEKFTEWVTGDVLPSIRKHGAYMTDSTIEKALTDPDFLIKLATNLKEEKQKRIEAEKNVQALTPKAQFYDDVAGSKDAIEMANVAKVLAIKGFGRNNLFEFLRKKKILNDDNIPYQHFIDRGYFRTIEQKYNTADGTVKINIKTLVFQKGIDYIRKLIKEVKVA